jgi:hypothetical protein
MKGQITYTRFQQSVSGPSVGWRLALALILCGLVGVAPHLALTHEQNEVALGRESSTEASPLIGVTSSTQNPLQIALLHWYNANLTTTFTVGGYANAVAFDGANIWVTSQGGTVASCGRATARRSGPSPSVATPSAWPLTGPISG